MVEGGPGPVVFEIIDLLQLVKPALLGYAWGASISLFMGAHDFEDKISQIVAFMPSMPPTDSNKLVLKKIKK